MMEYTYHMPTQVVLARGCLGRLAGFCAPIGSRPFLVTGRGSARRTGSLDRALTALPDAVVFDKVEENPSTETCEHGAALCRAAKCDLVVALGGGSPMDAAKAIAVLATNDGACADFFGKDEFTRPNLPLVAIATTSGTGSEVTPYAVITNTAENTKRTIAGSTLFPRVALLDPDLAATMPASVTANTGLDALSQAMEGVVSRKSTPKGDILAYETCRVVREWLPRAVRDGADLEARAWMMHAAMLSGCVIAQSGTTLVHGMGYYLTSECDIPHGLANACCLAPVFRYNARHLPLKVAALARALGVGSGDSPADAADAVTKALHGLLQTVDVSPAARDAGVPEDQLRPFAEDIHNDASRFKNQVGEPTLDEVLRLFREAWAGA